MSSSSRQTRCNKELMARREAKLAKLKKRMLCIWDSKGVQASFMLERINNWRAQQSYSTIPAIGRLERSEMHWVSNEVDNFCQQQRIIHCGSSVPPAWQWISADKTIGKQCFDPFQTDCCLQIWSYVVVADSCWFGYPSSLQFLSMTCSRSQLGLLLQLINPVGL